MRLSCLLVGGICFIVAAGTFQGWGTLNYQNTMGLFITYLVYPLIAVAIYIVSQFILVIRTLDDRWVIGDLLFGIGFYVVGCILLLAFSTTICDAISHYLDGVFFFTLCMLFTVMMVYKYWDCESGILGAWLTLSDHEGGPRVLGRLQGCGLGGQGPSPLRREYRDYAPLLPLPCIPY